MGISTHILDTALGLPATGVPVSLSREDAGRWPTIHTAQTDGDGRLKHLLPEEQALVEGTYRIRFDTAGYYAAQGMRGLYPFVEITFTVSDPGRHFHIPLLLTANGYTTYRGS